MAKKCLWQNKVVLVASLWQNPHLVALPASLIILSYLFIYTNNNNKYNIFCRCIIDDTIRGDPEVPSVVLYRSLPIGYRGGCRVRERVIIRIVHYMGSRHTPLVMLCAEIVVYDWKILF